MEKRYSNALTPLSYIIFSSDYLFQSFCNIRVSLTPFWEFFYRFTSPTLLPSTFKLQISSCLSSEYSCTWLMSLYIFFLNLISHIQEWLSYTSSMKIILNSYILLSYTRAFIFILKIIPSDILITIDIKDVIAYRATKMAWRYTSIEVL